MGIQLEIAIIVCCKKTLEYKSGNVGFNLYSSSGPQTSHVTPLLYSFNS